MKNKDVEKQLRQSLSEGKDRVWKNIADALPKQTESRAVLAGGTGENIKHTPKAVPVSIAAALATLIALAIALTFIFKPFTNGGGGNGPLPITFDGGACFYVDINPSVQVSLDTEGKVTAVHPLNEDAHVMLSSSKRALIGKTAEQAAVDIWRLAYNTGYISPTRRNNAVLISGSLSDEASNDGLNKKLKESLLGEISANGVYCAVLTGRSNDGFKAEADKYNITESKYSLILAARALGAEIAESEYEKLTVSEINARMAAVAARYERLDDDALERELERLEDEAEERIEGLIDIIDDALDAIEDYIEDTENEALDELAEDSLERLEDILDRIEDRAEDGKDIGGLFKQLKSEADLLSYAEWATDPIKAMLAELSDKIDEVEVGFELLEADMQTASELKQKHDSLTQQAQKNNHSYTRPERFDEDYEEWLEDVYDDYYSNWSSRKAEWESSFDD